MKRTLVAIAMLALLTFGSAAAFAGTITYTESATATGTIGGAAYTDALVTLTLVGDTANVTGGGGFFTNTVGTFMLSIAGVGSGTFTDSGMEVFDNQGAIAAGFGDLGAGGSVLDTFDAAFGAYDLTTAIGPITGANFIRPDLTYGTTLGAFTIAAAGLSTFTATTTATPEPGSLMLLGSGVIGLAGLLRRKMGV